MGGNARLALTGHDKLPLTTANNLVTSRMPFLQWDQLPRWNGAECINP